MATHRTSLTGIVTMSPAEFADRFGSPELAGALCGYTRG